MRPESLIVAGPNGSGKTTFAKEYLETHDLEYLSADAIAEELGSGRLDEVRIQAGRTFFNRVLDRIGSGRDFLAETTLAGRSFLRILHQMKEQGYSTSIVFVFLESPSVCIARVRERVRKGGHNVPPEDIERRFHRSIRNFWSMYRNQVDRWHLVYNSSAQFKEVAIGDANGMTVKDDGLLNAFMKYTQEK